MSGIASRAAPLAGELHAVWSAPPSLLIAEAATPSEKGLAL